MRPSSAGGANLGSMGPPHMGPLNSQIYDFPPNTDDDLGGSTGKGKKKRETKKKEPKPPKTPKTPKTPKGAKGRGSAGSVGPSSYGSGWYFLFSYQYFISKCRSLGSVYPG